MTLEEKIGQMTQPELGHLEALADIEKTEAFIAAWLPGTEGQGVTDVLLSDYKPTGKLSFT